MVDWRSKTDQTDVRGGRPHVGGMWHGNIIPMSTYEGAGMSYVLATTENVVRWYAFDPTDIDKGFELVSELDLRKVPQLGKDDAKRLAQLLGLKTWRYVKLP